MKLQYDESHWYSHAGWPRLRRRIGKVAVSFLPKLQEAMARGDQDDLSVVRSFVGDVLSEIASIVDSQWSAQLASVGDDAGMDYSSSMWAYALPLLGDTETLIAAIARDARVLRGQTNRDVSPPQALRRTINMFLEDARRKASASSEHRLKTWEAIDGVSWAIARDPANLRTSLAMRCSNAHVQAVFEKLKTEYRDSKNIPNRQISTLWAYFDEFCDECVEKHEADYALELQNLAAETDVRLPFHMCLEKLKISETELFEALAVSTGLDEANGETKMAYLARTGIGRHVLDNRYSKGVSAMRDCIEASIQFQLKYR